MEAIFPVQVESKLGVGGDGEGGVGVGGVGVGGVGVGGVGVGPEESPAAEKMASGRRELSEGKRQQRNSCKTRDKRSREKISKEWLEKTRTQRSMCGQRSNVARDWFEPPNHHKIYKRTAHRTLRFTLDDPRPFHHLLWPRRTNQRPTKVNTVTSTPEAKTVLESTVRKPSWTAPSSCNPNTHTLESTNEVRCRHTKKGNHRVWLPGQS